MPSRNRVKEYAPDSYYHVYNRGIEKRGIFADDEDCKVFLNLLKNYLGKEQRKDRLGRPTKNYYGSIELLSFCLMPNHFHLFIYQNEEDRVISEFMRSIMTSYVGYFNQKYERVGGLFQDRFKASRVDNEAYLWHISRYIHLNPLDIGEEWREYPYSSYRYYTGEWSTDWVMPRRILDMHKEYGQDYQSFVTDYEDYKESIDLIKHELAN